MGTRDNIVPCCFDCNCAKNTNFSYEEMMVIGAAIAKVKQLLPHLEKKEVDINKALNPTKPQEKRWHIKTVQYDMSWNIVRVYKSIVEASIVTGFSAKCISAACNSKYCGNKNYYHGFYWKHE